MGIKKITKKPSYKFWVVIGLILIILSILYILLFFNIIPSKLSDWEYGKLPVLFIALFFLITGIICVFNKRFIRVKEIYRKIIFLIILVFLLTPFHIIIIKEIQKSSPSIFYSIYQGYPLGFTILLIMILVFDIIVIIFLIDIIKLFKNYKNS